MVWGSTSVGGVSCVEHLFSAYSRAYFNNSFYLKCVVSRKLSLDGKLIGPQGGSPWLNSVPDGMYRALMWVYHRYDNPIVIVTENGCDIEGENDQPMPQALQDNFR